MTREEQITRAAHEYIQSDSVAAGNEILAFGDFINGAKWADFHPQWIPVEEELPKEQGRYMFRLSNGDMCYETYYPKLKLVANVTHWMPIVPPRKEE